MTARPQSEGKTLAWMCVLIGVNQLGFGAVIPVLPLYAQSFGVSQTAIGFTVAIYGLARLFVALPSGRIADLFGRRNALALGGLICCAGNLWCAYASTFTELAMARFVSGAGAGLTLTAGMIVLTDITTPSRRGRVMAIYQGVFLFAVGIGPIPGGYLAEEFGLSAPFLVYAVGCFIAAVVAWWAVAETKPDTPPLHQQTSRPQSYTGQLRAVLRAKGFLLAGTVSFFGTVVRTGALFSIVPLIGTMQLNLTATQIGIAMGVGSVLGVMVSYPAGVLVDLIGRKSVIVPATIASGFSFVLYGLAPDYTWFILACAFWGVASSASGSAPAAYAADVAPPEYSATAMSVYRTLADSGYVLGPILLGVIADAFGMTIALMVASSMLIAVALLFAFRAPESYRPRD